MANKKGYFGGWLANVVELLRVSCVTDAFYLTNYYQLFYLQWICFVPLLVPITIPGNIICVCGRNT